MYDLYSTGRPPPRFTDEIIFRVSLSIESFSSSVISHSDVFWDFLWIWIPSSPMFLFPLSSWIREFTFEEVSPYTKYFPVPIRCSWNFIRIEMLIFWFVSFVAFSKLSRSISLSITNDVTPFWIIFFSSSHDSACVKNDIFDLSWIISSSS